MARGADEKNSVIQKILQSFDGSFLYNGGKEIRIPLNDVQIKVTLACAKDNVEPKGDSAFCATPKSNSGFPTPVKESEPVDLPWSTEKTYTAPSQEELDNVSKLMASLGL